MEPSVQSVVATARCAFNAEDPSETALIKCRAVSMLLAEMAPKISGKVIAREMLGNSITKFSKFLNRKTKKQNLKNVGNPESKDKQPKTTEKSPSTKNPQQGREEYLSQHNNCLIHLKAWVQSVPGKQTPALLTLGKWRQEELKFKVTFYYTEGFKSAWDTRDPDISLSLPSFLSSFPPFQQKESTKIRHIRILMMGTEQLRDTVCHC